MGELGTGVAESCFWALVLQPLRAIGPIPLSWERRFSSLMASGLCRAAVEAEQSLEGEQAVCACSVRGHTTPITEGPFPAVFGSYRNTMIA